MPTPGAAALSSSSVTACEALSGFHRKATREIEGSTSLRSCSRLGLMSKVEDGVAGDVAAGPGKVRDQPGPHRIADADDHDRNGRGGLLRRARRRRAECRDQVDRHAHQFRRRLSERLGRAVRGAIFVGEILALDIADVAQAFAEIVPDRRVVDDADADDLAALRLRRQRPRHQRTAEQLDEFAPTHALVPYARVRPTVLKW